MAPALQHKAPQLNGHTKTQAAASETATRSTEDTASPAILGDVDSNTLNGTTEPSAADLAPLNQRGLLLSDGLSGQDYFERPENQTLVGLSTYDLIPRDYVQSHSQKQKLTPEQRLVLGVQLQQEPPEPQDLMYHLRLDLNSLYEKAQEPYDDNVSVSSAESDEIAAHEPEWPDVDPNISASDQLRLDFPFNIETEAIEFRRNIFTAFVDEFAEVYSNQGPHLSQHLDLAQNINTEIASLKLKMLHILAEHTDASDEVTTEGLVEPLQHKLNQYAKRLQSLSLYQMDLLQNAKRVADAAAQRFHSELVIASQLDPAIVSQESYKYQQVIAPMPRPKPARSTLPGTLSKERKEQQLNDPHSADGASDADPDGDNDDDADPDSSDNETSALADGPHVSVVDSESAPELESKNTPVSATPSDLSNGRRRSTRSAVAEATPTPEPEVETEQRSTPKVSLVIKPPKPQTPSPAPSLPDRGGRRSTRASSSAPEPEPEPQPEQNEELFCICRKPDTQGTMVGCENDDCPIGWYHTDCLGLKSVPTGEWYCPTCTEKSRKRRRR